jgi:SAM-dependent methyltransferase
MGLPPNLRTDAFAGTAEAYLRYRPAYPRALLDDLLAQAPGRGLLVDLACGPGRVALDLAPAFARTVAIDLEPEMVAVGRAEAARRGLGQVEWRVGRAEAARLAAGSVDLVTVGEAFHRLDQARVLRNARRWLKPGGGFATLGGRMLLNGTEPWSRTLTEVALRWMPAGWAPVRPGGVYETADIAAAMRSAGFQEVAPHPFDIAQVWSFDALLGCLSSLSVCSKAALGEGFAGFAEDVRRALGEGPFEETVTWSYILGRQP